MLLSFSYDHLIACRTTCFFLFLWDFFHKQVNGLISMRITDVTILRSCTRKWRKGVAHICSMSLLHGTPGSVVAWCLNLSLAHLRSKIIHALIGQDVNSQLSSLILVVVLDFALQCGCSGLQCNAKLVAGGGYDVLLMLYSEVNQKA